MDIGTIVGIVLGFGLIIGSIVMGSPLMAFINIPGLLIVVGGTLAATLIAENLDRVIGAVKVAMKTFRTESKDVTQTILKIVELSQIARREGVLALENQQIDEPFLAKAIRMAVDNIPPEEIKSTLGGEMVALKQRHTRGQKLFRFMAATAPSMGMIGTLIGLVQMLRDLDNPSAIGPAMAVALLTTLYGAVMAFLLFGPIADKLEKRTSEERVAMMVVIDGIESIIKGLNATIIQEKLEARIAPDKRQKDKAA